MISIIGMSLVVQLIIKSQCTTSKFFGGDLIRIWLTKTNLPNPLAKFIRII